MILGQAFRNFPFGGVPFDRFVLKHPMLLATNTKVTVFLATGLTFHRTSNIFIQLQLSAKLRPCIFQLMQGLPWRDEKKFRHRKSYTVNNEVHQPVQSLKHCKATKMLKNASFEYCSFFCILPYALATCLHNGLCMHMRIGEGAYAGGVLTAGAYTRLVDGHVANSKSLPAYATEITQQKPTLPLHACANCEISGQQPAQLYMEHYVGHSKIKLLIWG